MKRDLIQYIIHPTRLLVRLDQIGLIRLDDVTYLRWMFKQRVGYDLNLKNPKSFNEKIQWLKLNDKNDRYTDLVDKLKAKEVISKIIGDEYIIPTIGVWDKFDDIDFDALPDKFVLKTTHDSGGVVVVKDKNSLDVKKAKKKINKSLRKNYFYNGREWPYFNIEKKIIAEPFVESESEELMDYKLMVFNGKVKCSFTCTERFSEGGLHVTFFDNNWEVMPFERHYPKSETKIDKPVNFEKMIELSEKLAKDIRFVRIDFYEAFGKLYFGEMTFYPGSGIEEFTPVSWDYKLGDWLDLNESNYLNENLEN
ncbi:MAG: ATP-grasp fold amidoligase family protein [Erysipelotrichaceae bacterium]|nr:ATP-grasp fold amidoligase family protein [Erysipelotrichaceae bacterium]